jgi:ribosomal protein S25
MNTSKTNAKTKRLDRIKTKLMKRQQVPSEKYIEALQKLFLDRVKSDHSPTGHVSKDEDGNYYWKWVSTQAIANELKVTYAAARHSLHKLLAQNKIHVHLAKRGEKMVVYFGWAAAEVPGYKEHKQFGDYRTAIQQ